jgi:hypothetical protein
MFTKYNNVDIMDKQTKMVKTTDYWYPNYQKNKVLVILMECKFTPRSLVLIIRGEGDFALKKHFPIDNADQAKHEYNDAISSCLNINECYNKGFVDYIDKSAKKYINKEIIATSIFSKIFKTLLIKIK